MRRNKYQDEYDEFLHPFWLGLLMLFTVIIVTGMVCLLRKKFGSRIRYLFNRLCCKNELNNEHHSKTNGHLPITTPYNWAPVYIPPPRLSPKLYKIVRNIQMINLDKESTIQCTDSNDDTIENDVFAITDECDYVKTSLSPLNENRSCETARKFFASMRQASQGRNSSSIDGSNIEPSLLPTNRLKNSNDNDKLKLFHTPRFFKQ